MNRNRFESSFVRQETTVMNVIYIEKVTAQTFKRASRESFGVSLFDSSSSKAPPQAESRSFF